MERRSASGLAVPSLRGREDECTLLDELLHDVRRGRSRSLAIRGEAGIGKTALLGQLVDLAPDFALARGLGVESDMELAYASLHQLCAPLLNRTSALPDPQR